jgi:hypothetical protein
VQPIPLLKHLVAMYKINFMKNTLTSMLAFVLLSLTFQLVAAGPDHQTKKYQLGNFQKIELGSDFDVVITKGNTFSVVATGRSEDLENLEVEVVSGTLKFDIDASWSWWGYTKNHKKIRLAITMPRLKAAEFSGASHVRMQGFNDEEQMNLNISGASKLDAESLQSDKLVLELSGASHVELSGRAAKLDVELSGASHLNAQSFIVRDADINASGASHAQLGVQKSLQVDASGASKIEYTGNPLNLTKDLSGASVVRRVN